MGAPGKSSRSTRARVLAYSLVSSPMFRLPDEALVDEVRSERFSQVLEEIEAGYRSESMAHGISLIKEYASGATIDSLDGLARDRTYLFRALAPGVGALPPYESSWRRSGSPESTMSELSKTYRQEGIDVASGAHERVDYLGVELAFMMRLAAREEDAPESELDALRMQEARFFFDHPGEWAGDYARAALPHARTDFFEGLMQVLLALIEEEATALRGALR